ncbi:C6 transcription factor [Purpureocillium lavendulum]|uniref:C6 transcription factor n=1 Tax=Purpureocillium lavendulum TaxID=1247861 RepID=A0AB34G2P0_9HYPO|nr:C6 transcription factor [Purpureocillium lavendulum]
MVNLGLGDGFAKKLARLESNNPPVGTGTSSRVRLIQHQEALTALAAFSSFVHVWYPVLRPGFSERYLTVISGPLTPGSESCMVLLVAAIGTLAQQDYDLGGSCFDGSSELFLEAAMASLPAVLIENTVESVQCLVLLSIYHCCLSKPCQAYDYAMIASFKVQNLLKYVDVTTGELYEHAKRAYWAVLLLESELRVQFDVVASGIWDHDDHVPLPNSRRAWQFDVEMGSPPQGPATTPGSNISSDMTQTDQTQSYFLAEISMRRMLHRCNTAIRRNSQGGIVYAPKIARELELQLDEWYKNLPDPVRFQRPELNGFGAVSGETSNDPQSSFLCVQYYCCKLSIYWPAVYQSMQDDRATTEVLKHCERFFNAYMHLMPNMLICIRYCIVNRWTLYASIFMTSMAVIQASQNSYLRSSCIIDWPRLLQCVESTVTVDRRFVDASPSLSFLEQTLAQRVTESRSWLLSSNGFN